MAGARDDLAFPYAGQQLFDVLDRGFHRRHAQHAVALAGDEHRGLADHRVDEGRHQLPIAMNVAVPVEPAAKAATAEIAGVFRQILLAQPGKRHVRVEHVVEQAAARRPERLPVGAFGEAAGCRIEHAPQRDGDVPLELALGDARLLEIHHVEIAKPAFL